MITFNYNKDKRILETFFTEKVTQKEIIDYLKSISKVDIFPTDLKILIDSTKGSLSLHPGQLYYILDENVKLFSHYNTLKIAIAVDRPIDTALAVIYTRLIQLERHLFQVFNTTAAAAVWLNKGQNVGNIRAYPNTHLINNVF